MLHLQGASSSCRVQVIATRMGFAQPDVELLAKLVGQHLLLPKIATSRDLADRATLSAVAAQVGTVNTLETLYALTEADSLATGPSAWSPAPTRGDRPRTAGSRRRPGRPPSPARS